jgi:hypothetical protein
MERYAQLVNGIINQVIESETDPDGVNGEWVLCGNAGPGWTYDNGVFTPPIYVPPVEQVKYLSKLGFRNRFTPQEKALIEFAALDDPSAAMPARMLSASIRATLADQRDATYIDPTRPDTRQGVIGMEAAGLLTAGRALMILDTPIEDHEMFKG